MDIFATNFGNVDWWIVGAYLAGSVVVGLLANRYIHNVAGFMVGGRGSGAALNAATYMGTGLGLVTIMYASIDGFQMGFAFMVLGLIGLTVGLTLGTTGFVVRRLRERQLTTIPEYFDLRYSRNVRVTAGAICALMGILNMGLFPRMGATFITYATGLGRVEQGGEGAGGEQKGLFQLRASDIRDWEELCADLQMEAIVDGAGPGRRLLELRPTDTPTWQAIAEGRAGAALDRSRKSLILRALNDALKDPAFYDELHFEGVKLPEVAKAMLKLERASLSPLQVERLNRALLEAAYPQQIAPYGARQELMINLITSALIALVLLYTVLGGMVSVIVTDYVQFIILGLGLGLGLYFCLFGHPDLGWANLVGALKEHRGARAFNPFHKDSYTWVWVLWMAIHFAAAALCWAPEATRALTARDPKITKRTFLFGSPGQFIRLALPALLAIAAYCYVSQSEVFTTHFFPAGLDKAADHADQAMPLLLGKIVPSGLLGLLVAGLMAAFMSTHDSYFLCWASIITRDVIAPLRGRELSDRQQIRTTRILILVIGAFLLGWGVWFKLPESVWTYMAVTGSVWLCGAIVVLVGGMFWRRASNVGAIAALLGGFLSFAFIFDSVTAQVTQVVKPLLPAVVTNKFALLGVVGLVNYAFCLVLFVIFSLLFPNRPDGQEA